MVDNTQHIAVVEDIVDAEATDTPFGKRWACQWVSLKPEHLRALQQGKLLAIDAQEEYVIYLQLDEVSHV